MQKLLLYLHYTILKHPQGGGKQNKLLALQPNYSHCEKSFCIESIMKKYQQAASRKYKDMTTDRQEGEISKSVYQCLRSSLCPCLSPLFHESSSRVKKEGMRSRMREGEEAWQREK